MPELVVTILIGLGGVALGAALARRNHREAATERLLVEALNDLSSAIADVSNDVPGARARYASATARIALHGSPRVVMAFRQWQEQATTMTPEGRMLLVTAMQKARRTLGHQEIADDDLATLLFGPNRVGG